MISSLSISILLFFVIFAIAGLIVLGIILFAVAKGLISYKLKDRSQLDAFKKRNVDIVKTNLYGIINQLKEDKKIITKKYFSDYVIVSKCGVILLKYVDFDGTLHGNSTTPKIKAIQSSRNIIIDSPFYLLEQEKNKLMTKVNSEFYKVIVKSDNTNIKTTVEDDALVCTMSQLYYKLEKIIKKETYDKDRVEEIYKSLVR